MKILHIAPEVLTVPAINGGAVEGIIEKIIGHNDDSYALSIHARGQVESERFLYVRLPRIVNKLFSNRLFWDTIFYALPYAISIVLKLKMVKGDFDILHVHNRPQLVPLLKYYFKNKIVINHIHNEYLHLNKSRNLSKESIERIARSSDAIITVSDFISKGFISDFPIYQNKTFSLHNAIEVADDESKSYSQGDIFNITDEKVILFTGRLVEEKGAHDCIDICISLINKGVKLKLIIVGGDFFKNGRETAYIKNLKIQAENFKEQIYFTGFIDSEDAARLYKMANVFLFTPIWDDPSPLVIYEAMANSLPIITTRSGGIPEIIMDDEMVFAKGDIKGMSQMVLRLITDETYAAVKGRSNHDRFHAHFTYDHYCQKLKSIYDRCFDRSNFD